MFKINDRIKYSGPDRYAGIYGTVVGHGVASLTGFLAVAFDWGPHLWVENKYCELVKK